MLLETCIEGKNNHVPIFHDVFSSRMRSAGRKDMQGAGWRMRLEMRRKEEEWKDGIRGMGSAYGKDKTLDHFILRFCMP